MPGSGYGTGPTTAGGPISVLVVDDDEDVRSVLVRVLTRQGHRPTGVASAEAARRALDEGEYGLMLCDVMMQDETGIGLLAHVHVVRPELPVVMVSGINDLAMASAALDLGAFGYVTKPFDQSQLLIAVANALRRARLEAENAAYRANLEAMVEERTAALSDALDNLRATEAQVRQASEETVRSLTRAIEGRDVETGHHIERMSRYSSLLARRYGLDATHCELIRQASPMHDVGKIGVPDGILFKPGRLSVGELEVVKQHPELGFQILSKSEQPLLVLAASIARSHHERWDGSGYPLGLAGESIPLEGRIAAVADVFDALVSRRVYKPPFPLERAVEIIVDGRGTQFDGSVVDVLIDHIDEVVAIQEQYPDN